MQRRLSGHNPLTCTPCNVQGGGGETAGGSARSSGDVRCTNLSAGGALGGSTGCLKWGVRVFQQAAGMRKCE
jgi:hypothetical protein